MGCSLRSLPKSFNPTKLSMLSMGGPCTTPLIKGLKNMRYLKSIKLSFYDDGRTRIPNCFSIRKKTRRIPDLSGLTSLEYLELSYCNYLVQVHPSVGRLDKLVILKLRNCDKLRMFQKSINMKSLETLDLSWCPLKFFPEIEGDMKSLSHLDLSWNRAIKELPLSLYRCPNLTNVPSSIFYGLQRLEDLDLRECYKLVTFPTESDSLPPPPVFSTNLTSRLQVHLGDCESLQEISEFPREIDSLYVSGCESLKRISKLSKILEGKDSKMFGELDLTNCWRLCDNLARTSGVISEVEVDKRLFHEGSEELMGEAEKLTALLTLFFSCAKSEEFRVRFGATARIPYWFTCRQDANWDVNGDVINKELEFCIKIPQNSNWDNKGLALCIQSGTSGVFPSVYINGIKFDEKYMAVRYQVCVHYIPFVTLRRRLSECGMDDDNLRVMFRFENIHTSGDRPSGGSCGVHLIKDLEGEGR
ncbi:protein SUPPRESSOR OF npr1-1, CONSTITUTIVE 1-like [Rosa chinensis]|uniref:protein SUPPRESSOR OF npr1-1, CONSTITUTIVE 1-like n=1 Tax=Rosa chinensis TaxID=74649 RepID=UPI001AD8C441|nr:protein SUPPRESSOR OF npr1-1, CONSTITUTIVE 1-like [Rosa chinensis]